jgi:hypothetical protein
MREVKPMTTNRLAVNVNRCAPSSSCSSSGRRQLCRFKIDLTAGGRIVMSRRWSSGTQVIDRSTISLQPNIFHWSHLFQLRCERIEKTMHTFDSEYLRYPDFCIILIKIRCSSVARNHIDEIRNLEFFRKKITSSLRIKDIFCNPCSSR